MENRVAVISIIVEKGEAVSALNSLLHEYSEFIIGRMGIPYRERKINIICLAIDAPNDEINALTGDTIVASGMARYDGDRSVQAVFERADSKMYKEKKLLKNIGTGGTARL